MEKWILIAIGLVISSTALYLLIRKAQNESMSIAAQGLSMFLPPVIFAGLYNIYNGISFALKMEDFIVLILSAAAFSWLGNIASLKSIKMAPNPGYSLVISKSYVLMTTIISVWLFGSELTIKSLIAIILIVIFSGMIMLGTDEKAKSKGKQWIWYTFGAFFAWDFSLFL